MTDIAPRGVTHASAHRRSVDTPVHDIASSDTIAA
jgi:hypothetical protein